MVVKVTTDTFESEVLNSDIPVVLDCYADWCGPCKMMAPILEEISGEYEGKVKFCKINVDEDAEPVMKYKVVSIPTFLFFKGGEKVDQAVGAMPAEAFKSLVDGI